jgi:proline iminopeptidase
MRAAVVILATTTLASSRAVETRVPVPGASLYARTIGHGPDVIVLHGGPDFDQAYLLPDLDRLQDSFRLIYYDQRARGRSADRVRGEDVTLASDLDDLDRVRQQFRLKAPVLLGHSWGAVLALEYALRYPSRVSRLILMNPAPVSKDDLTMFRKAYLEALGPDMDRQREIVATPAYKEGVPDAVAARYRIHFEHALARTADYEKLMAAMKAGFMRQGRDGIVKARTAEDGLMRDTWNMPDYDLLPKLQALRIPTLVITGDRDFIPVDVAAHIARALPGARLTTIPDCGHFAYLECPAPVRTAVTGFFKGRP